jgi:hypothetical protein
MIVSLLKRIFHLNGHDDGSPHLQETEARAARARVNLGKVMDQWSREETGLQWRYDHPDPARSLLRARNGE